MVRGNTWGASVLRFAVVGVCCVAPMLAAAQSNPGSQRQFIRLPSSTQATNPAVTLPSGAVPSTPPTAPMAITPKPPARPVPLQSPAASSATPEMSFPGPGSPNQPASANMPGIVSGGSAPELPAMPARRASPASQRVEEGQVLVSWGDEGQMQQGLAFIRSRYGVDPSASASFANLGLTVALFQLPRHDEAVRLKEDLARAQPSWAVDFNTLLTPMADARHYALAQMDYPAQAAQRASAARIGMLDSDVEEIPALRDARITIQDFVGGQEDPSGRAHGTAIASLLVGIDEKQGFRGIAAGAEVSVAAIVMQRNRRAVTNAGMVVTGLDWLLGRQVQVVNISLGGPQNAIMALAIKAAVRRSVVVVAAAGNGGPKGEPLYPAAYPDVIAATAVDAKGNIFEGATRGQHVLVAAPGVDVWVPDAAQGRYVSGTSFAAAYVAGASALLRAAEPRAAPAVVKERLCGTAKESGAPGRDPVYGCGLLQVSRVLGP